MPVRMARRADRLSRVPEELLCLGESESPRRSALVRGVPAGSQDRADPLHRQGHHLFPHAVLARDAPTRGHPPQGARPPAPPPPPHPPPPPPPPNPPPP